MSAGVIPGAAQKVSTEVAANDGRDLAPTSSTNQAIVALPVPGDLDRDIAMHLVRAIDAARPVGERRAAWYRYINLRAQRDPVAVLVADATRLERARVEGRA